MSWFCCCKESVEERLEREERVRVEAWDGFVGGFMLLFVLVGFLALWVGAMTFYDFLCR